MVKADARNFVIAQGLNDVENDELFPKYEIDSDLPPSEQFADGWEDAEHDAPNPNDDWVSELPRSALKRRPIIQFFKTEDGILDYRLADRNSWVPARVLNFGQDITYRETKHDEIARHLLDNQESAIEAANGRTAYRVAKSIEWPDNISSSYRTKSGGELIGCLWGSVPLHFLLQWPPERALGYNKIEVYNELFDLMLARHSYLMSNGRNAQRFEQLLALPRNIRINRKRFDSYCTYLNATRDSSHDTIDTKLARGEATYLVKMALGRDEVWNSLPDDKRKKDPIEALAKVAPVVHELVSRHRYEVESLRRSALCWTDDTIVSHGVSLGTKNAKRGKELVRFAVAGWEPALGEDWYLAGESIE